jgi:ribonucleoside-diphosphate reductase beta chain
MHNSVFNELKTVEDYNLGQPLFFGKPPGLFDTIHKRYPKIWDLYKLMKSLDWDEAEFDYTQCNLDFKNCPKNVADMMRFTIFWQWESDSVASRSIAPVLAPFITDSSLWAAWSRISENEILHSCTYSEVVRMSFDDPEKVLEEVISVKQSISRMESVNAAFDKLYNTSHKYALGLITADEAYDDVFMGVIALLLLERIQFMASFAITFTICSTNLFQPIGKAVQKIAQDELEVHAELDKEVIRIELGTERGKDAYTRLKPKIKQLCDEVVQTELTWADYLFSEGRELVGTNANTVKQFVLFNAREVYKFLDIESEHKFPTKNPMPHVEDWINISNTQAAPQEQDGNQYKLNSIVRDDSQTSFDVDF